MRRLVRLALFCALSACAPGGAAHRHPAPTSAFQDTVVRGEEPYMSFLGRGNVKQFFKVLIRSENTGGQFTVIAFRIRPQARGPGFHVHQHNFETFHVLEGELTLGVGGKGDEPTVGPGSMVNVAPGSVHNYVNTGSQEAVVVTSVVRATADAPPVSLDQMFLEFAAVDQSLPEADYQAKLDEIRGGYDNASAPDDPAIGWRDH